MIDTGLCNKTVLVTGGNNPHGIGAATARAFAEQGALVFIHYYRSKQIPTLIDQGDISSPGLPYYFEMQKKTADAVVREICDRGGKAACWELHLAEYDKIPELFDRAEEAIGPVDVLVNNACEYLPDTFIPNEAMTPSERVLWENGPLMSSVTAESHDQNFAVTCRAPVLMMAEFVKRYYKRNSHWGRIVNVGADCSDCCPSEISYRAGKYALESYTRSAAAELGPYGITVNAVLPGPVQSGYISPEAEAALIRDIPLRRIGQSNDLANAIVFFASEQASWITGQVIKVHGGHRMALGR